MKIRAVIFDLDGTLLDTIRDIADSMNRVLSGMNCQPHDTEAYKRMVGDGMRILAQRVLPESERSEVRINEVLKMMKLEYAEHWRDHSKPFPGVVELLQELSDQGLYLGVLSNKPDAFTQQMVAELLPAACFSSIAGAREGVPTKPDPAAAQKMMEQWGLQPGECMYVGDSDVDMKMAKSAGMVPVGAGWGYRSETELWQHGAFRIIGLPDEVLGLIRPLG